MRRAPDRTKSSPTHLAALVVIAAAAGAACKKAEPPLRVLVAATYDGKDSCPETTRRIVNLPGATSARLSARLKDAQGNAYDFCDARFAFDKESSWGFEGAAAKVDVYLEVYGADGKTRIGSGALLDLDPKVAPELPLVVYPTETYACSAETRLNIPRAFHTATLLPDGSVVFVGGITAGLDGKDTSAMAVGNDVGFFATDSVEFYDARTRRITQLVAPGAVRAFHRAAVLSAESRKYTILLAGGVTADDKSATLVQTDRNRAIPTTFRFSLLGAAKPAPSEILSIDASVSPPVVTRSTSPQPVQDVTGILQGAAELPGRGIALAGGMQFGKSPLAQKILATTRDGVAAMSGQLVSPRAGSALVAVSDSAALLVGGLSVGGEMASPFERLDLAGLKATALTSSMPLPTFYLPTVTSMDPPGTTEPRLLVSGALEVVGLSGNATHPPKEAGYTMTQVRYSASAAELSVLPAVVSDSDFPGKVCSGDQRHYKVVAFDAASRLPAGDRMLVTGGTPRDDADEPCRECEDGDDHIACALGQSLAVSIPKSPLDKPVITPLSRLTVPRFGHTQTVLPDGTVLIVGGLTRRGKQTFAVAQTEIMNPANDTGAARATMGDNAADVDDPVLDRILSQPVGKATVRDPGGLAYGAGGDPNAPSHPCQQPKSL